MKTTIKNINKSTPDYSSLTGRYLEPQDITGIIKLQDIIAESLEASGTPRHIVKRSESYFIKHLFEPHAMYGIIDLKGEIVAQSIFRISDVDTGEELCVDSLPDFKNDDKLSVAQGVLVHPDYQSHGLMQAMLEEWFKWCKDKDVHHLAARTESSHHASQKSFLKNEFNKVSTIIDPKDNAEVCVFHRILDDQELSMEKRSSTEELQGLKELVIDLTCS